MQKWTELLEVESPEWLKYHKERPGIGRMGVPQGRHETYTQ